MSYDLPKLDSRSFGNQWQKIESSSFVRSQPDNDGVPCSVYIHIRNGTNTDHAHFCLCSLFEKGTQKERNEHLVCPQIRDFGINKAEMIFAHLGKIKNK